MKYVLVDYENVQENELEPLLKADFAVTVFAGNQQNKVSITLALLQRNYKSFWLEQIEGNGKNALDFHIAFVLGQIFQEDPESTCYVISKDNGFDPLITKVRGLYGDKSCFRVIAAKEILNEDSDSAKEMPVPPPKKNPVSPQKIVSSNSLNTEMVIKLLKECKGSKPMKKDRLDKTISNWAKQKKLSVNLKQIIKELQDKKVIAISETGKLKYKLQ